LDIQINQAPSINTTPLLPDSEAQKVLWKLAELNFCFKLLVLDKHACQSNHDEDTHQDLVQDCFGSHSLLVVNYEQANMGLGSVNWCKTLPCLLSLWKLMKDWDGMKATPLLLQDHTSLTDYSEVDVLQLEDVIARFYTDTFFYFFGHAPVIPTHLP
jgi:hypothetical protein